jgi:hypothetical protein
MAGHAKRPPIAVIPKELAVATVRVDMIDHASRRE